MSFKKPIKQGKTQSSINYYITFYKYTLYRYPSDKFEYTSKKKLYII